MLLSDKSTVPKPAVLIIGQDSDFRRSLELHLNQVGCSVTAVADTSKGVQHAVDSMPDVVMVGPSLPEDESWDVCRQIRAGLFPRHSPAFLFPPIAERANGGHSLSGIVSSASWHQVDLAVSALATLREDSGKRDDHLATQGLEMDRRRFRSKIDGHVLNLTRTEFRLLWTLAAAAGEVFDRQQLTQICHGPNRIAGNQRVIDVHIKSLRNKLGERSSLIETVHGVGYRLREETQIKRPR